MKVMETGCCSDNAYRKSKTTSHHMFGLEDLGTQKKVILRIQFTGCSKSPSDHCDATEQQWSRHQRQWVFWRFWPTGQTWTLDIRGRTI